MSEQKVWLLNIFKWRRGGGGGGGGEGVTPSEWGECEWLGGKGEWYGVGVESGGKKVERWRGFMRVRGLNHGSGGGGGGGGGVDVVVWR